MCPYGTPRADLQRMSHALYSREAGGIVKKCASCTKDLPDAALHCVFCGAKQPPAPATAGSAAKTVMGHASSELIEQLKAQAAAVAARQASANLPAAAPYSPPQPAPAARPPGPVGPMPGSPPVPSAGSVAPTMFAPAPTIMAPSNPAPIGGPMPGGPMPGGPMPGGPMGGGPMGGGPMGGPMPHGPMGGPAPMPGPGGIMPGQIAPIPASSRPLPQARTGARPGRPIEPWKDSLRLMMFIWGGALLVAFMTPVTTKPEIGFWFNAVIDGEGIEKLFPLLMVAVGLLAIVLALIPMSPMPRGLIAGLLGMSGIVIPELLLLSKGEFGLGQILDLVSLFGTLMLVPGLLIRAEYRDSIMPRIMVTIGALCILASVLIPQGDSIPLVEYFKAIIDAPGKAKVGAVISLGRPLLAILSLLAWLPSPSSGGAKVFAWLLIAWGAVELYTTLLVMGDIGDAVSGSPYVALVAWIAGFPGKFIGSAYLVLTGFGFATVFGKKLE